VTARQTYDLLAFLGDVGGIIGILEIFGGFIASGYAKARMQSIFANKMFLKVERLNSYISKKKVDRPENGRIISKEIKIPNLLELRKLWTTFCCCCCIGTKIKRQYKSYKKVLEVMDKELLL